MAATQRLRRIATRAALAAGFAVLAAAPLAATAAEWNTNGRTSWGPCATVEFTLDATTLPAGVNATAVRTDLRAAADLVNDAAGRTLVTISNGTVIGDRNDDGINTVDFADLRGPAGVAGATMERQANGDVRYVDAGITLDRTNWTKAPADSRRITVAHEMGHTLGLGHVADAHEVMSYAFINDGDGLGEGTAHALRSLYSGTDCGQTPTLETNFKVDAPTQRADVRTFSIADRATNVRDLAVDVTRYRAMADGGATGWADRAVICRDDVFADCLGGSALAGQDGLLLFVPGGAAGTVTATDRVVSNMNVFLKAGAPVYVLGGTNAVSAQIESTLAASRNVTRLAGSDRYATAATVAQEVARVHGAPELVLIARGNNPADAVAAGAVAADRGLPILLTPTSGLHSSTASALDALGIDRSLVLGGNAAVSDAVVSQLTANGQSVDRVAGATRFGTAVAIAKHAELWNTTSLKDGQGVFGLNGKATDMWALALAAAPYAASMDAPVLLTTADAVPTETGEYLMSLSGSGRVTAGFVGVGTWADSHAAASFSEYLSIN